MTEPLGDFGDRVRRARERKGYTQDTLAKRLDISRTYLSHIEGGRAQNLSFRLATKIAEELDIETPATDLVRSPIPASLRRYADQENLSDDIVQTLAGVQYRGRHPDSEEQWRILHQLIRATIGEPKGDAE